MITFIIPTLWKSDRIHDTINSFNRCSNPDIELIIIDNTNSDYVSNDKRINVIKQEQNIFVNPAWNLGVSMSHNKYVCIANDDISLNINVLLNNLDNFIETDPNFGIIGCNENNIRKYKDTNNDTDVLSLIELDIRTYGFGCMMILNKNNYIEIPDCFKIFYGDDYLYYYNKNIFNRSIYSIENLSTPGEISVTSIDFEKDYIQKEDKYWQDEIIKLNDKINKNI